MPIMPMRYLSHHVANLLRNGSAFLAEETSDLQQGAEMRQLTAGACIDGDEKLTYGLKCFLAGAHPF